MQSAQLGRHGIGFNNRSLLFPDKKPLTNQDVVDMVKASLDERTITKAIETSDSQFDTAPQSLILLKNQGVSDGVLTAMLAGGRAKPQTTNSGLPTDIGVYWMKDGAPIGEGSRGCKLSNRRRCKESFLTDGLDKGHVNGAINGAHSRIKPPFLRNSSSSLTKE